MIRSPLRLSVLPVGLALVALAGCGSQTAAKAPTVGQSTTPAPAATAKPLPTPVVTGASAAVVNGHTIPLSQFRLLLTLNQRASAAQTGKPTPLKTLTKQTMDEVVINELVREYAVKHNIKVTAADVDKQEQTDVAQSGGQSTFNQTLARYGMTIAEYRTLIATNLLGVRVEQAIAPVKAKMQHTAHVRHILFATQATTPGKKPPYTDASAKAMAQKILAQIKGGADFAALAKKYSNDPGSAAKGGDLGTVYPGEMVASFNAAVFSQKLNVPTIVKSQYGYHIIEVLSRGMAPAQPTQQQQTQQRTAFMKWITAQKKAATIKQVAHVAS